MPSWLMDSRVIGTIGLCLDILGAIFVAIEVVKIYKGDIVGTVENTWHDQGTRYNHPHSGRKRVRVESVPYQDHPTGYWITEAKADSLAGSHPDVVPQPLLT